MNDSKELSFPDRYLRRVIELGRLSHAYLLLGSESSGRLEFALELSKRLFCDAMNTDPGLSVSDAASEPPALESCGVCPSCRSISHDNHAGVTVFQDEERSVVDIETIRTVCERSHYARDHAYVAIIPRADTMTVPAANALLKTLEEPLGEFVLILLAASEGSVLPTIVSRCHRIHFPARPRVTQDAVDYEELSACERPDFWAKTDIRAWLERVVPDGKTIRERVSLLIDDVILTTRERLADGDMTLLEELLELRSRLDGNTNADLVLERLLAQLRQRAGTR